MQKPTQDPNAPILHVDPALMKKNPPDFKGSIILAIIRVFSSVVTSMAEEFLDEKRAPIANLPTFRDYAKWTRVDDILAEISRNHGQFFFLNHKAFSKSTPPPQFDPTTISPEEQKATMKS